MGNLLNRRGFLVNSAAVATALGAGAFVGQQLFADRTDVAARVDEAPPAHPLVPALEMATESMNALEDIHDYQATFIKRERVGRKVVDATMDLKLRENPFSVYLKFLKPSAGREVIYNAGQNGGKLQAHDVGFAGLAGTISLDPTGSYAMADNRYPVTMIGMRNLVASLLEQWLEETKLTGMTVNYYPNARIGSTSCKAIESSHKTPAQGVKFQLSRLYIASDTGLPIRVQQYEFPGRREREPVLVEDYLYTDIKTNIGLTDTDFSTHNPRYGF
ncbi:MAG: DUF1571 domain-containing protein [Planctomycetaceae bacterium]|nr:DUF1571 domain-containing protein [Planctomycetaceae bacterium]